MLYVSVFIIFLSNFVVKMAILVKNLHLSDP